MGEQKVDIVSCFM